MIYILFLKNDNDSHKLMVKVINPLFKGEHDEG
jgi:hypothetical protein